jgi:hypothetical protein
MAQLRRDNEAVLKTLEEGDLVEFDRGLINHWGVYVGMYQCPLSSCIILLAFLFHISFEYSFQSIIFCKWNIRFVTVQVSKEFVSKIRIVRLKRYFRMLKLLNMLFMGINQIRTVDSVHKIWIRTSKSKHNPGPVHTNTDTDYVHTIQTPD